MLHDPITPAPLSLARTRTDPAATGPVVAPSQPTESAARRRPHLHLVAPPMATPGEPRGRRGPGPGQQMLELTFALSNGSPTQPDLPRRLMLVGEDDDFGPRPTSRSQLPPASAWVARLAIAVVEALLGQRPAQQLVRWTTHEVLVGLQEQSRARLSHPSRRQAAGQDGRPRSQVSPRSQASPRSQVSELRPAARQGRYTVRSLRIDEPADGVVEATVLLTGPGRPIPLALRLEGLDGRWICTVVDSPDRSVTGTAPLRRDDEN